MEKIKIAKATLGLSAALLLAACGNGEQAGTDTGTGEEASQSVGEAVNYTITGIEPGAGTTTAAENTLEAYDNLDGWELETSSTAGMLTQLDQAIQNEEPIVITGWSPHYKFIQYDLKYLEDPKGAMGEVEDIHTLTRLGLEEDMPDAYQILDAFEWEVEDMETIMYEGQDIPFEEAAANWIEDNQETVNSWLEGTEPVNGTEIELVSMPWDSERASSQVMKLVLEQQGYSVTITDVDPAVMFEALANGEADASIAPWLPVTQGAHYEKHKDDLIDLGPNLSGARLGYVVPEYMDIDSIEDLDPNE